jgi:uncharacterized protein
MRTSSYVIYVDLPDNCDEMLLVHGYTGAYDRVSTQVANFVRSLELRRPPKPLYGTWSSDPAIDHQLMPPSDSTIETLRRRGYLTDMGFDEEEEMFKRIAAKLHQFASQRASYIFMPTYNCNLRCSYCFQDHMRTKPGYNHLLRLMTRETVDRIFKGIINIELAHGMNPDAKGKRSVGFFGGEPLLAANRAIVQYIMEKFPDRGEAVFWAVSNATELEAYEDILSPEKLGSIQITLDGPPTEHDKRRIYEDRSGSFAKIARNISLALDRGVSINIRLNVDRCNISQLPELAEVIHHNAWDKYPNFSVYTAPIRAANQNVNQSEVMDSWELDNAVASMQEQHPLVSIMAQPDDGIKRQAFRLFKDPEHVLPNFRESFCSAHTGMYIFDSFADIYACWERTGDPSVRIGRIGENGDLEFNAPIFQLWRTRTVASNPVCRKCRYALHCGGGCAVLAQGKTGELHTNYCDGFSSRFRANVAEAYLAHISGKDLAEGADRLCDQ